MYGQSMNRLLKYLLVPVYMVAMAPVAIPPPPYPSFAKWKARCC